MRKPPYNISPYNFAVQKRDIDKQKTRTFAPRGMRNQESTTLAMAIEDVRTVLHFPKFLRPDL